MLSKNISFKNFNLKLKNVEIKKILDKLLIEDNEVIKSLTPDYKYKYSKKFIKSYKKENSINIIGMGGSILGTRAIHDFLKKKIKKKNYFL